jgi:anti-sigma B factor antagonist
MNLSIDLIKHGNEGELVIKGRLDSITSEEAGKIFDNVAERFDDLTIDMKDVDYISSAGLRVFLRTFITLNNKNGTMKLKNVDKAVMEVFEITGFAGLYTFI